MILAGRIAYNWPSLRRIHHQSGQRKICMEQSGSMIPTSQKDLFQTRLDRTEVWSLLQDLQGTKGTEYQYRR
jgi:hypothetical protein